jgi:hypothetical protein
MQLFHAIKGFEREEAGGRESISTLRFGGRRIQGPEVPKSRSVGIFATKFGQQICSPLELDRPSDEDDQESPSSCET